MFHGEPPLLQVSLLDAKVRLYGFGMCLHSSGISLHNFGVNLLHDFGVNYMAPGVPP